MGDSWKKNNFSVLDLHIVRHVQKLQKTCHLFGRLSHLSCSKDGHIALTLAQEGQITSGEVIFLFSFACGQVKDTVPYPVTSFQHCVDSWKMGAIFKGSKYKSTENY